MIIHHRLIINNIYFDDREEKAYTLGLPLDAAMSGSLNAVKWNFQFSSFAHYIALPISCTTSTGSSFRMPSLRGAGA